MNRRQNCHKNDILTDSINRTEECIGLCAFYLRFSRVWFNVCAFECAKILYSYTAVCLLYMGTYNCEWYDYTYIHLCFIRTTVHMAHRVNSTAHNNQILVLVHTISITENEIIIKYKQKKKTYFHIVAYTKQISGTSKLNQFFAICWRNRFT